jgi:hypothetical protein
MEGVNLVAAVVVAAAVASVISVFWLVVGEETDSWMWMRNH